MRRLQRVWERERDEAGKARESEIHVSDAKYKKEKKERGGAPMSICNARAMPRSSTFMMRTWAERL